MNSTNVVLKRKIMQGWMMLFAGLLLLLVGFALPLLFPRSVMNFKWVEGFGILLLGWGGIWLARYRMAARSPETAKRTLAEDRDERNIAIRSQAGNLAFMFTTLAASFVLIIYSAMTRSQLYDALWLFLAGVVIVPSIVYVVALTWLQNR